MEKARYAEIQKAARRKIAQRKVAESRQPVVESADANELVSFPNSEALLEAVRKG